uniref:C3H1-type domain-containing protein n=1 Tax=Mucochytrium quahogii TaxID=96639 RepID=A0A7S2W2G2_9STRA|mmetsp:Transcript_27496/g.44071  ORF Transcript_27496/g.44071 Transcript_27496/m.44071 type:complete len:232 (+) Transcript_27496:342-1037(+)
MGKRKLDRKVCHDFVAGKCTRDVCRFSHDDKVVKAQENQFNLSAQVDVDDSAIPLAPSEDGEVYRPRQFEDRCFTRFVFLGKDGSEGDTLLTIHRNGVVVVGIPPDHPCLDKSKRTITEFSFCDIKGHKLEDIDVSGSRKKGSLKVDCEDCICRVVCSDDKTYKIFVGARGQLIELNKKLLNLPSLLGTRQGYIAILNRSSGSQLVPGPDRYVKHDQYAEIVRKRRENNNV